MSWTDAIDAGDRQVRRFGILFGIIALLVLAYLLYRGSDLWPWLAGLAAFFFATGLLVPSGLRPVYVGWMRFAFVLAWINTRLLLGLFFFLVITPIGLLLRVLGKDLLGQRMDRSTLTYWIRRERKEFKPEQYERLF